MIDITFLLCMLSFLSFGLATEAHHRRRCAGAWSSRRCASLRRVAWGALALALVTAVIGAGWVFGAVFWSAAVMTGAAAAFLALNLSPPWVRQSLFERR